MRSILLIPFIILTGCLTTTSEHMATFVGQDSHFLMREMGAPTKKEKDSNGEVWIYETTSSKIVPEKTVEKVTKRDAEGRPSVTESETFPAHEKISIRTKYFFFDSNGRIYDTKYNWDTIDKR